MKKFLTNYVAMNPSHCVACWQCVEQCPKHVIGKVGFLWHKHAAFCDADACIGCKKCIKVCPEKVFFVPEEGFKVPSFGQRLRSKLMVESLLPLLLLAVVVTGVGLHIARHGDKLVEYRWAVAHIIVSLVMVMASIRHIVKRKR